MLADHRKQPLESADPVEFAKEAGPAGKGIYFPCRTCPPTATQASGPPPLRYHDKLLVGTGIPSNLPLPQVRILEPKGRLSGRAVKHATAPHNHNNNNDDDDNNNNHHSHASI